MVTLINFGSFMTNSQEKQLPWTLYLGLIFLSWLESFPISMGVVAKDLFVATKSKHKNIFAKLRQPTERLPPIFRAGLMICLMFLTIMWLGHTKEYIM